MFDNSISVGINKIGYIMIKTFPAFMLALSINMFCISGTGMIIGTLFFTGKTFDVAVHPRLVVFG